MTVGENIKRIRKEKGLKQKDLAEVLNVSEVMISQWENGSRNPKQSTLIKIAKALDVHLRDLADSSIWEEFDRQHPEAGKEYVRYGAAARYLEEMGFTFSYDVIRWHWEDENETDPAMRVQIPDEVEYTLTKDGHSAIFTETEFEELQTGAKEAIEGRFYKKVLDQQKKN